MTADSRRRPVLADDVDVAGRPGVAGTGGDAAAKPRVDQPGRRLVFPVIAVGVLLSAIDLFIVNVALTDIGRDVGVSDLSDLSWVLNGYTIVFAALLVPAGRLGDVLGNKSVFLAGMLLFVVSSAACAVADDLLFLVVLRVVQAVGAAAMVPTSLGLVLSATAPDRRAVAVRLWAALGGLGAALGPVLGGLLVEASWRWVFLVNVPLGLLAVLVGLRVLPAPGPPAPAWTASDPDASRPARDRFPDPVGTVALVVAVAAFVASVVNGQDWGWASGRTLGLLAVAGLGAAAFAISVARSPAPLVDLELLRAPNFAAAALNTVLFNAAFGAMLLSVVLWMQTVWGWSAVRTGLAIAPGPLLVPVVAVVAGRAITRFGPGPVMAAGGVVYAAGVSWWAAAATVEPNYAGGVLTGMLLTGVGVALSLPPALAVGTSALPPDRFATGSAVLAMTRQVGLALGVAALVAVLAAADTADPLEAFRHAWWLTAGLALLAAAATVLIRTPADPAAMTDATTGANTGTNTDAPRHEGTT